MTARPLTQEDFSHKMPQAHLETLNLWIRQGKWETVKWNLPESFMQRRIVCLNYKSLQNIISQRKNHRLEEWQDFINQIIEQVEYPGFLIEDLEESDLDSCVLDTSCDGFGLFEGESIPMEYMY